jgi:argininosuccinate synthase
MSKAVKKVVLAYSGGLDTSVILRWLQDTYNCEVVTFTADLGQGEELEPARKKAEMMGIKEIFIEDLREEFVRDFVFPMFRGNALYEGTYLLGTSIARPLIAKRQIEIAEMTGADAVAHGATGKGNDQVRFELGYYALKPDIRIISPWREWDLDEPDQADRLRREAPDSGAQGQARRSALLPGRQPAAHLLGREDPRGSGPGGGHGPDPQPHGHAGGRAGHARGNRAGFRGRRPRRAERRGAEPADMLAKLNELGGKHGIGCLDIVENRFIGMKSRGVYETPGGTILFDMRRAMETLTLDRGAMHLKDELMPRYAEMIYNGFWFAPEREMLQAAIDHASQVVTGRVTAKLYKGNVMITGRSSPNSLYDADIVTFEEDSVYDHRDAEGFIKLNALRLRLRGRLQGR